MSFFGLVKTPPAASNNHRGRVCEVSQQLAVLDATTSALKAQARR